MRMDNQHNLFSGESLFDGTLNLALLDDETLFNEETLETMAQHVFATAPAVALNPAKENEIIRKLTDHFGKKKNRFRMNMILLALFAGASVFAIFIYNSKTETVSANENRNASFAKQAIVTPELNEENLTGIPVLRNDEEEKTPEHTAIPLIFSDTARKTVTELQKPAASFYASSHTRFYIPEDTDLPYEEVPNLSEAEMKQTAKDKLKILKDIARERTFCKLPSGATNVNGKLTNVNAFQAKQAEVTNLEYRTFLNDLLVEKKMDEYLLARPAKGGWKALGLTEFEDVYFENVKYNDFPAVNMTRKGAELYCEWLTRSMRDAITKKEIKWSGKTMPDFRLPSNVEWIYAARACDTTMAFPWGMVHPDSTQNTRGCFLCNFNYTISVEHLRIYPQCPGYVKMNQKGQHRAIITTAGMAIDTLLTAPVTSYNPNNKGLYCTMGNVSEMVWTWQADTPGNKGAARSMGGNWNSHVDNVRIESAEQYVGITDASPLIGFRPVMVLK